MRQVFQVYPVGEERNPGLQDSLGSPEYFFDKPGTGPTPHPLDLQAEVEAEVEGLGELRIFILGGVEFRGGKVRLAFGDNPSSDAGPIEFGIPEVLHFTSRAVKED
jgi:hypothetical protein